MTPPPATPASPRQPATHASPQQLAGPDQPACVREALAADQRKPASVARSAVAPSQPARVCHPICPVFDDRSRVLLLGTMPSPASRQVGFYYGHPRNRFWTVLARLFGELVPATVDARRDLALRHGIALWDVLAECTIRGASDASIGECVPNDIAGLLKKAPIEAVFCTGAKAAQLYSRYCESSTEIEAIRLPSTSPANASASLEDLVEAYRCILPYCRS
ncbi:DNA-deoxyinosine glycosylase [Eggerthellaceae bacterium zg-887]|nr:DNA-deoxyinosine glycosylase [Xiamenia xianingshaonis]